MPKISLWNPVRGSDFNFIDRAVGENFRMGCDGVLIHMYEGPPAGPEGQSDTTLTTVEDVLFLENPNRIYNPNVIELRGHHVPQDTTYDLAQFGVLLSSDVIRVQFHYQDMIDSLGRKLIAGDVLEFPSMVDVPVFNNATGINRYYVVIDALWAANSYGPKWFPHAWLVRAQLMTSAPEYSSIVDQAATGQTAGGAGQSIGVMPDGFTETADSCGNPGLGPNPNISNSLNLFCQIIGLTDEVIAEAQQNAFFDPKFFESANLFIWTDPKTNYPLLGNSYTYFSGDGAPPNTDPDIVDGPLPSGPLVGAGIQFPPGMTDGQYYLRLDYYPERLFQKQGNVFRLISVNILKNWTAYNKVLDTFIDNINQTVLDDGTVMPEKQPVSQILKQKVDLYAERRTKTLSDLAKHQAIADKQATQNVQGPGSSINGFDNPFS